MNVLIINTFDIKGGAARAAYRLFKGLNHIGVNSDMLVKEKKSKHEKVFQINPLLNGRAKKELEIIDEINRNYIQKNRTNLSNTPYSLGYPGYDLVNLPVVQQADVINLHWVAKFQSIESISNLLRLDKPVIWTLHDENPFTGGCHYTSGCIHYINDCNTCPQLVDDPFKLPFYNLKNKIIHFQDKIITVVSPSQWIAKAAKQSQVFKNSHVEVIPNSVEHDIFTPKESQKIKSKLRISPERLTILTGISGWLPKRKGFSEFIHSIKKCLENEKFKKWVNKNNILLLGFGIPALEMNDLGIPFRTFGDINSDITLSDIYNASDIFVLPSIEDNLPNMLLEAMACGTPVISFATGGINDVIEDGITGRIVSPGDTEKLSQAILDLVFNAGLRERLGRKSSQLVRNHYTLEDQAQKYVDFFKSIIPKKKFGIRDQNFSHKDNQHCYLNLSFNSMLHPLYRKYFIDVKNK